MDSSLIFKHLLHSPDYARRVLPFLKPSYFKERSEQKLLEVIQEFSTKYNNIPTMEIVSTELANKKGMSEVDFTSVQDLLTSIEQPSLSTDVNWLVDTTEEFCKSSSCYAAVLRAINIMNDEDDLPRTAIPEILREALAVTFSAEIGHDYIISVEDRYRKLHEQTARLKFDIDDFNAAYSGGVPRKTLSCWLGQTGGGKSLFLSHFSANFFKQGYNVLYVTLELAEERIGERIDANLFGINVADVANIPLDEYKAKIKKIGDKTKGRFFIKEYPPACVSSSHLRSLLDELKIKQDFVPDVIVVDYLNLMVSARYKAGSNQNSYTLVKAIAEELRSIAVEYNCALFTASQMNRSGFGNSDADMTATSESIGLPATVDSMFAIIRTEELDAENQVLIKVLKTRFSSMTNHKFVVGIDLNQMRIYSIDAVGQTKIQQDIKPEDFKPKTGLSKKSFSNITV